MFSIIPHPPFREVLIFPISPEKSPLLSRNGCLGSRNRCVKLRRKTDPTHFVLHLPGCWWTNRQTSGELSEPDLIKIIVNGFFQECCFLHICIMILTWLPLTLSGNWRIHAGSRCGRQDPSLLPAQPDLASWVWRPKHRLRALLCWLCPRDVTQSSNSVLKLSPASESPGRLVKTAGFTLEFLIQ